MNKLTKQIIVYFILFMTHNVFASEFTKPNDNDLSIIGFSPYLNPVFYNIDHDSVELFLNEEEWKLSKRDPTGFYPNSNLQLKTEDKFQVAWKVVEGLSINFNIFEDSVNLNNQQSLFNRANTKSLNQLKSIDPLSEIRTNRQISGYTFGVESELGLGKEYKLGLNVDFGQIYGADLLGFGNKEVSTTSFGVGIRNSSFGASVNTDIYLENKEAVLNQSRLGFELDWHFSDNGKLSFGSKKSMEEQSSSNTSIDDITGSVQYIKFQHNL